MKDANGFELKSMADGLATVSMFDAPRYKTVAEMFDELCAARPEVLASVPGYSSAPGDVNIFCAIDGKLTFVRPDSCCP